MRPGVGPNERDDLVFIKAIWRYKRRLVAVIRVYPYLVISAGQIQLGKDPCTMEFIQQILNIWQWVSVLGGYLIQASVINTHSESRVWLFHEDNRCCVA